MSLKNWTWSFDPFPTLVVAAIGLLYVGDTAFIKKFIAIWTIVFVVNAALFRPLVASITAEQSTVQVILALVRSSVFAA